MRGTQFVIALAVSVAVSGVAPAAALSAAPNRLAVRVIETTPDGAQSLAPAADLSLSTSPPRDAPVITVDTSARFQTVHGFGAALTDSSAWLIHDRLAKTTRNRLMNALFGTRGIDLRFLRLPIGASDFTAGRKPYSYDDLPPGQSDPALAHFSIRHDRAYIIPTVRRALSIDPRIEILATPWSPPPWMKSNHAFDNTAGLGSLLPSDYGPLARYFVKFIQAYAAAGIRTTAVTPQNEPEGQSLFPGLRMAWPTEAMWIVRYLQPALRAARLRTKIYAADVGWSGASYQDALVRTPARKDISGVTWHCYGGSPAAMQHLRALAPHLDEVVSECAIQITPLTASDAVIGSLRNGASTVALWNLALTPSGGPVQPPDSGCRGCRGLVSVSPWSHSVRYSLAYYQLGQFSRFILRGARRVGSNEIAGIEDVAVRNRDGSLALVAYNTTGSTASFAISWAGRYLPYSLPPRATATFVWG